MVEHGSSLRCQRHQHPAHAGARGLHRRGCRRAADWPRASQPDRVRKGASGRVDGLTSVWVDWYWLRTLRG
eukprot:2757452-Rhodomonas_salina.1